MCGRYTLTLDQEALAAALGVAQLLAEGGSRDQGPPGEREGDPILPPTAPTAPTHLSSPSSPEAGAHPRPRYNVAPTQEAPVVVPGRGLAAHRWGLIPSWAEDPAIGSRLINARSETAHRKPSFRHAFRRGRCLVPVDGFYEWVPEGGRKTPWWIHRPDRAPFTLAGLREVWTPPGGGPPLETFTILTCEAVGELRRLHHRLPLLVAPEHRGAWLHGPQADPEAEIAALLGGVAGEADALTAHPVSTRVNRPSEDDPGLVEPVDDGGGSLEGVPGRDRSPPLQGSLFDPPA